MVPAQPTSNASMGAFVTSVMLQSAHVPIHVPISTHAPTMVSVHRTAAVRLRLPVTQRTHALVTKDARAVLLRVLKTNSTVVRIRTTVSATGSAMGVNALRPALVCLVKTMKFVQLTASAKAHYQLVMPLPIVTEIKFAAKACVKNPAIAHALLIASEAEYA